MSDDGAIAQRSFVLRRGRRGRHRRPGGCGVAGIRRRLRRPALVDRLCGWRAGRRGRSRLLAARLRWPWAVTVSSPSLVGYLVFGAALAVPSTAIAGVVPSVESLRQLTVGVVTSWRQLLTVAVPVGTAGAVMIPVYLTAAGRGRGGHRHRRADPSTALGVGSHRWRC